MVAHGGGSALVEFIVDSFYSLGGTTKNVILMIVVICFIPSAVLSTEDPYDNRYCHDPDELQKWYSLVEKNPDSDQIAALHALWIGLCAKVEAKTLTTSRANQIFEDFRAALIKQIQQQQKSEDKAI